MSDLSLTPDFEELSQLIAERRAHATRLVNRELIDLYWELGKRIHLRIKNQGWGRSTVTELADYLSIKAHGMRGFSASNLWRMRQFYETWLEAPEKLVTLLRELSWSAHLDLIGRCKTIEEKHFYLVYAVQENLSVRQLRQSIDTANYERVTLVDKKLATPSRDLATSPSPFKDSYLLDFMGLTPRHSEKDLRKGFVQRLGAFLRELGRDFCYIGEEYPIQVGNRDGSVDLLFFHRGLNSLIAIELKITNH